MIAHGCRRGAALGFLAAFLFWGASTGSTGAVVTRSVWDGVYSAAQAERGRVVYERECVACHAEGPSKGETFMTVWNGRTADDLYQQIKSTMPQDGPGRLTRANYLEIVAYTFRTNGFPSGTVLTADPQELQGIRIEPKPESTPGLQ